MKTQKVPKTRIARQVVPGEVEVGARRSTAVDLGAFRWETAH